MDKTGFKPTKQELAAWLDKQTLCVIATNGGDGYPNAASVAFSQSEAMHFVIMTHEGTRKAQNIARDGKVALTITNQDDKYTLQVEGEARQLAWSDFEPFAEHHYAKLPFTAHFRDIPGYVPFVVKPVHMRFCDITVRPWEQTEYEGLA